MKKFLVLLLCLCTWNLVGYAQEKIVLNIYHTNDSHSRIEPFADNYPDKRAAGKAGVVRRVTLFDEARKQDPDALFFDCGDFSQGSPYYNLFKGTTEIDFMNLCHYDVGIIGNHEFDFGMENMRRIFQDARFPIVCANYDMKGTILEDVVKPYTIIYKKGVKIGVFGLGAELEGLVQYKNYKGLTYLDPAESANKVADILKNQEHCDLVICLSHCGWRLNPNIKAGDEYMIAHSRNIDLVLGGHSHTYMEKPAMVKNLDGKEIPCYQMGKNAQWVGHIIVTIEK